MILLYTPHTTSRITYTAKYLFNTILGVPVTITQNKEEFREYDLPKINYSNEKLGGIFIQPHSLLFEQGIRNFPVETGLFREIPILFPTLSVSSLPFDPLAATFFMITRYEEYWAQPTDYHNRVSATASLAHKHKFLHIPVVEHWALFLKQLIHQYYQGYPFPERQYKFIPTIDVDIAYAYRYRSWSRLAGAIAKAFLKADWEDNKRRYKTLIQKRPDPYDTFSLLHTWHKQYHLKPIFFFLLGKYGLYDKNISPGNKVLQQLIRNIHNHYPVGIHPSYQSNRNDHLISNEITTLRTIINDTVYRSRQHFLMLRIPDTYLQLIKNGITEDYTMGYASRPGFRAGTCTPFRFYDLRMETETSLTVYPFQVMDGTLNQYLKLTPLEAIEVIINLIDETKKVNGTFISLWHNESLSDIREWHRWREVYKQLLGYGSNSAV